MLIAESTEAHDTVAASRSPIMLVAVSFCLVMIDGYDMFIVAFLAPLIAADLNLTPVAIGQMFAAGLAGSMIGGLVLGPIADRVGRRPTLIVSLLVAAVATALCAFATSFPMFAALRFVAGFGLGGVLAAVIPLVAEHFPVERRHAAVTTMFVGYPLGGVIGGALTAMLMEFGWRNLFLCTGLVTALIMAAAFLLPEPVKERTLPGVRQQTSVLSSVLSSVVGLFAEGRAGATVAMAVGVFSMLLVTYLLVSWTPMIAVRSGFTPHLAALCGAVLNLGGVIGALASTLLVRKFELFTVVAAMIAIGALAIAALGQLYGSIGLLMSGLFVAGALAIGGQQSTPAMAVQLYPQRMRAAGSGWQFAVGRLGSIMGPMVGGYLMAASVTPQVMFVAVACPAVLAALAYAVAGRMRPR